MMIRVDIRVIFNVIRVIIRMIRVVIRVIRVVIRVSETWMLSHNFSPSKDSKSKIFIATVSSVPSQNTQKHTKHTHSNIKSSR